MKWVYCALALILVLAIAIGSYFGYQVMGAAVTNTKPVKVRIRSGWTLHKLATALQSEVGLKDTAVFSSWVRRLGYEKVRPCTIQIEPGSSIKEIAQLLKSNRNQTINITILGSMDKERLANGLAAKLEIDKDSFLAVLQGPGEIFETGFTDTNWQALCIPNTYNFSVGTGMAGFFSRMKKEYEAFWNEARREQAEKQGLTPIQVAIIASIVTKESNKTDEYENIAGVYINRLRRDMLLQADPTVVFVRNHGGRVTGADLKIESPYNTYLHKGLPPGPICIPNISSIEAVLNYTSHDYIYFVALADFSGYHHFSKNLAEHLFWAAKFHAALNARNIR